MPAFWSTCYLRGGEGNVYDLVRCDPRRVDQRLGLRAFSRLVQLLAPLQRLLLGGLDASEKIGVRRLEDLVPLRREGCAWSERPAALKVGSR